MNQFLSKLAEPLIRKSFVLLVPRETILMTLICLGKGSEILPNLVTLLILFFEANPNRMNRMSFDERSYFATSSLSQSLIHNSDFFWDLKKVFL